MAGDWIKMTCGLCDDPEVIGIADHLEIEEDLVVGKLHRFWSWADQKTENGNAPSVTGKWIDRYIGVTGFAKALEQVGWLESRDGGVVIPRFDIHMGQSAKKRAQTAKRVADHRSKNGNAPCVTKALPEKRREEKNKEIDGRPANLAEVVSYWDEKNLEGDPELFWDFYESKGWLVGKNPMKKWKAAASGWSRRQARSGTGPPARKSAQAARSEQNDEVLKQFMERHDGDNGSGNQSNEIVNGKLAKGGQPAVCRDFLPGV